MPTKLDLVDLLEKKKLLVEWLAYFENLKAKLHAESLPSGLTGRSSDTWENIEILMLEAFTHANRTFKAMQAVDVETVPMLRERVHHFSHVDAPYQLNQVVSSTSDVWRPVSEPCLRNGASLKQHLSL
jgi:hypothetical protein